MKSKFRVCKIFGTADANTRGFRPLDNGFDHETRFEAERWLEEYLAEEEQKYDYDDYAIIEVYSNR